MALRSLVPLVLLAFPAAAAGQTLPDLPADGGAPAAPAPTVTKVTCTAACAGTVPQAGSTVRLSGSDLGGVVGVNFLGGVMPGDEVAARPDTVRPRRVVVRVPAGAASGPVMVVGADGQVGQSPEVSIAKIALPKPTSGPIATAVTLRKAFVDGERSPTLAYQLNTAAPADVTVSVLREKSSKVVASFNETAVPPRETRFVSWGKRAGAFRFVVDVAGADLAASTAEAEAPDAFRVHGYKFPLGGRHDYGDGLGAGRGHQGTDVFAACGTPITAARGGEVKRQEFEGRAGNYLVVDQAGTGYDAAYMHLRDPALVEQGDRVRTGQLLGYVGQTGAASECHLHFEYWTAPGWYSGGAAIDAMSRLKRWDAFS